MLVTFLQQVMYVVISGFDAYSDSKITFNTDQSPNTIVHINV